MDQNRIAQDPDARGAPSPARLRKRACKCGHLEAAHREVAPRWCDAVEARRVCGCEAFEPLEGGTP